MKHSNRIRGLWRARVLIALARGPGKFNALMRECRLPSSASTSQILKRLEREGLATRTLLAVGPPTRTEWRLTSHGKSLIASARATIAEIQEKHQANLARASGRHKLDAINTVKA